MVNAGSYSIGMMIAVNEKSETTTTKKKSDKSDLVVLRPCDYRGVFFFPPLLQMRIYGAASTAVLV